MPEKTPVELAGDNDQAVQMVSAACRDTIEVVFLAGGGGLLSYRRADGTYVHTLNTPSGLERKLVQLRPTVTLANTTQQQPTGAPNGAGG